MIKIKKQLKKKKTKAKVDEEATKAKQSIDNATTNEAVDQAKTQGVTTITIQPDTIKRQKRNAQLTKSLKLRNKKLIITQMQQKKKKM